MVQTFQIRLHLKFCCFFFTSSSSSKEDHLPPPRVCSERKQSKISSSHKFYSRRVSGVHVYLPQTANITVVQSLRLHIAMSHLATNALSVCVCVCVCVCVWASTVTVMLRVNKPNLTPFSNIFKLACTRPESAPRPCLRVDVVRAAEALETQFVVNQTRSRSIHTSGFCCYNLDWTIRSWDLTFFLGKNCCAQLETSFIELLIDFNIVWK